MVHTVMYELGTGLVVIHTHTPLAHARYLRPAWTRLATLHLQNTTLEIVQIPKGSTSMMFRTVFDMVMEVETAALLRYGI